MEIKSLLATDFGTLFKVFTRAFADYELQLDAFQLQTMLQRRGFNPELSFAVFEEDEIVAFTFNGTGYFDGVLTAYDTGTGTLKEYRGQGLATRIFEYSIPHLRKAGISQYLLEVLQHNKQAVSIYRKLGFEVTREFNYFDQKNEEVNVGNGLPIIPYTMRRGDLATCQAARCFLDFHPSWQNSFEAIQRTAQDFICLGAFTGDQLVGYGIFEPVSGDITQIAVDPEHRRKGIASAMLREMLKLNKQSRIKAINTDINCVAINDLLVAKNIELRGKQFEMIRKI